MVANGILLKETAKIRKIAFVGDHSAAQVRHRHVHHRSAVGGAERVSAEPVPVRVRQ